MGGWDELKHELLELGREVGVAGAVDIALFAAIVYGGLAWLHRTRTSAALRGALILGAVYLLARGFGLALTSSALEAFFAVLLVAGIVIFRNELRLAVEQLASWSRRPHGGPSSARERASSLGDELSRALGELAKRKIGALVVLEGKMPVDGQLEGGTALDGVPSEPLLASIFDPHSAGHDGAVLIRAGRIARFGCHLPLSSNFAELGARGTRHAAALGLAERCDALCLVVSEERGELSIARHGRLRTLGSPAQMHPELDTFLGVHGGSSAPKGKRWRRETWSALAAIAIAAALWLIVVHGSLVTQRTFTVPVQLTDVPEELQVVATQPSNVTLTFAGTRRDLTLLGSGAVKLMLPLADAKAGGKVVTITALDVTFPPSLTLKAIEPSHVIIRLAARPAARPSGK